MRKHLLIALCIAASASASTAWADALASLEQFMRQAKTGSAAFTQSVTGPAKDGQVSPPKVSSGEFVFARPGRFSFVYEKPFAQTIIADGAKLWFYDPDLNQVTVRAQDQVLGSTPAALLASAPDLAALRKEFTLENAPDADGLQWLLAQPKANSSTIARVRVGFASGQLAVLDITDRFGQQSIIRFEALQLNPKLPAKRFEFTPPAGVDVLQQ